MATDKKSFLLYCDIIHTVNKLSDEQAGKLFKHILAYVNDLNPEPEDILTEIAFEPIKQSLKRDLVNYEKICFPVTITMAFLGFLKTEWVFSVSLEFFGLPPLAPFILFLSQIFS